jgi:hypothetical protein
MTITKQRLQALLPARNDCEMKPGSITATGILINSASVMDVVSAPPATHQHCYNDWAPIKQHK